MSDLLTHWAVADDCRRIALADAQTEPFFKAILTEEPTAVHLGAIARRGKYWMPEIFALVRAETEEQRQETRSRQRLAFAIGGILHFPADVMMKPLMSRLAKDDWNKAHRTMQREGQQAIADKAPIREISAYYDCHVFREVYLNGHEEPFTRFLLAENATEPGKALEAFVRALFQRTLLIAHTLSPDNENFFDWLDSLLERVQPLYLDIALYTRVYENPDPAQIAAFEVETAFYRKDDPAIGLARKIQQGQNVTQAEIEAAIAEGANQSGYGQAVALGARTMQQASAYWRGERPEPPSLQQR